MLCSVREASGSIQPGGMGQNDEEVREARDRGGLIGVFRRWFKVQGLVFIAQQSEEERTQKLPGIEGCHACTFFLYNNCNYMDNKEQVHMTVAEDVSFESVRLCLVFDSRYACKFRSQRGLAIRKFESWTISR